MGVVGDSLPGLFGGFSRGSSEPFWRVLGIPRGLLGALLGRSWGVLGFPMDGSFGDLLQGILGAFEAFPEGPCMERGSLQFPGVLLGLPRGFLGILGGSF